MTMEQKTIQKIITILFNISQRLCASMEELIDELKYAGIVNFYTHYTQNELKQTIYPAIVAYGELIGKVETIFPRFGIDRKSEKTKCQLVLEMLKAHELERNWHEGIFESTPDELFTALIAQEFPELLVSDIIDIYNEMKSEFKLNDINQILNNKEYEDYIAEKLGLPIRCQCVQNAFTRFRKRVQDNYYS